jgi:hypothetical protein
MGAIGDAFAALKNVLILQERVDGLKEDNARMADDLRSLTEKVLDHEKRLVRIETMIELSGRGGGQPRITDQ